MRPRSASASGPGEAPVRVLPRRLSTLLAAGIIVAAPGCDNVSWGGVHLSLQSAAPEREGAGTPEREVDDEPAAPEPAGPVLFLVQRAPQGPAPEASILPLATLAGDSLLPIVDDEGRPGFSPGFAQETFRPGRSFVLFSEGARVGSFTLSGEVDTDRSTCLARPRGRGIVEVVPEAAEARTFLALGRQAGEAFRHAPFRPLQSNYDQRVASLNVATELIPEVGAAWPPSVLDARRDLRIFQAGDGTTGAIAATFLHRDALEVRPAPADAYALFFIAENRGGAYSPSYVWYRRADAGKAAPLYLAQLDWNGDGSRGVVLEVRGAQTRWFAAVGPRRGEWTTLFEDPCGQAASAGRAGALD